MVHMKLYTVCRKRNYEGNHVSGTIRQFNNPTYDSSFSLTNDQTTDNTQRTYEIILPVTNKDTSNRHETLDGRQCEYDTVERGQGRQSSSTPLCHTISTKGNLSSTGIHSRRGQQRGSEHHQENVDEHHIYHVLECPNSN